MCLCSVSVRQEKCRWLTPTPKFHKPSQKQRIGTTTWLLFNSIELMWLLIQSNFVVFLTIPFLRTDTASERKYLSLAKQVALLFCDTAFCLSFLKDLVFAHGNVSLKSICQEACFLDGRKQLWSSKAERTLQNDCLKPTDLKTGHKIWRDLCVRHSSTCSDHQSASSITRCPITSTMLIPEKERCLEESKTWKETKQKKLSRIWQKYLPTKI